MIALPVKLADPAGPRNPHRKPTGFRWLRFFHPFLIFIHQIFSTILTCSVIKQQSMSTRIIVKNLPHNITAPRLKAHFSSSQSGNASFSAAVTDAKLVTDPKSGKSRGFAFVGYRTQEDALRAVEWFNGTFVDMRKIEVEVAKPVS
jgi:RNA recognition motif. (a.k.a. RRM, RBD, or RNP domain)